MPRSWSEKQSVVVLRVDAMSSRMRWGMVGGGLGSQVGVAHRVAACMDGLFDFSAGAVDIDPAKSRTDGIGLGLPEDRAYGAWREMLDAERQRCDRLDLVTVATPNVTHFEIVRAFLEAGFNVLCEKPFTLDVAEAEELVRLAREKKSVCGVNFGFSGYPMVRQARAMAKTGELGKVRVVVMEFAHGFHARSDDADNPRIRWRYDPKQAGKSAVLADAGIHALHMGGYVIGQSVAEVSADFASCAPGRLLEDDAALQIRFSDGAIGRLWTSAIAVGQMHGLTIRVFGEKGGLRWRQEEPNQIIWSPLDEPSRTLERGASGLHRVAARGSRIPVGHPEGMLEAFANIYSDLHAAIAAAHDDGRTGAVENFPGFDAGLEMVRVVDAATTSSKNRGQWTPV
jgi:predicted dehydrogenase